MSENVLRVQVTKEELQKFRDDYRRASADRTAVESPSRCCFLAAVADLAIAGLEGQPRPRDDAPKDTPTDYERGRAQGLAEAVRVVEDWLYEWSEELELTRNDYIDSLSSGEMNGRSIQPGMATGFAKQFRQQSEAVRNCINPLSNAIRAISPSPDHVLVPREEQIAKNIVDDLDAQMKSSLNSYYLPLWPEEAATVVRVFRAMIAEVK